MTRLRCLPVLAVATATLAACDPIWSVDVAVRAPSHAPIAGATLALVCPPDVGRAGWTMSSATDASGHARVSEMGFGLPAGCDVVISKPGFVPDRIRHAELCPAGRGCGRALRLERILVPRRQAMAAADALAVPTAAGPR